ncbi:MAG: DnaB-like helicase C-terminal domain-containing protein [Planctomycetota bacterium]
MPTDKLTSGTLDERLIRGSTVFDRIISDLLAGKADRLFDCGEALQGIEIGPGILTLIGAPTGRGKTALTMQAVYEAVEREQGLRAVVASMEVTEEMLIKRRIATQIGATFESIRFNKLSHEQRKQVAGLTGLRKALESIDFVPDSDSSLRSLESLLNRERKPGLLVLDYIQLFGSENEDAKVRASQTMATSRRFCAKDWAVVAVSALNRDSNRPGQSRGVGLDSFRDSSAIEYSGAAAYTLEEVGEPRNDDPPPVRQMRLRCLKNRNGERKHLDLWFNGPHMFFTPGDATTDSVTDADAPQGGVF